jgi:hypothetical protein
MQSNSIQRFWKGIVMANLGVNVTPVPSGVTVAFAPQTAGAGTISNGGAGSGAITGTSTFFLRQFKVGDTITAASETQTVREVTSDTAMVTSPFTGALSGVGFTINTATPAPDWQFLDSGVVVGTGTSVNTETPKALLQYAPVTTWDNGGVTASTSVAQFFPSRTYTGTGASNTQGVQAVVQVAHITNAPGVVSGSAVEGRFTVGGANTENWGGGIPLFAPAGVRGVVFGDIAATGTIPSLTGVMAIADATGSDIAITKMFGFALPRVTADNLTNGIGAGLYNVGGTNSAYLMLSGTALATPTGNWAIYDDTGLDSRLSGALEVGSDLVIDANAILHQYGVALPKNNDSATAAPTASDDATADYSVGSMWFWPATGRLWRLRDVTASAAQWVEIALADEQGYISGNWYMAPNIAVAAGAAPATGAIQLVLLVIKARVTLSTLGVRIVTSENGGNLQLALYANDPATGRPTGNAVATTAGISTSSTGVVSASIAGGNVTLEPGLYWAAYNVDSTASGNVAIQVPSPENHPTASLIGTATQANLGASATDDLVSLHVVQAYGTWPDLTSATFVEGSTPSRNGPAMHFRVA